MKSIKPGRGPSFFSGFVSVLVALFGVLWSVITASMGAGLFSLFGLIFVAVAGGQAYMHFKNATSEKRYSAFDIVDGTEEPDPLNARFGKADSETSPGAGKAFCPWCGAEVEKAHKYCSSCGREL